MVKADIPEVGMGVTDEEINAKEICQQLSSLKCEIAGLDAHLQYNIVLKNTKQKFLINRTKQNYAEQKFLKTPNAYLKYGQICNDILCIQQTFDIQRIDRLANMEEESTSQEQSQDTDDQPATKPPPIMLSQTANYTQALQEIHRKYPKTEDKGHIKKISENEESYRKIITYLNNSI
ncbi:hypothetical protein CDAR_2991 [Caerostris darwini]|uniref:Uncharacterized protein n=1 Tax=Caerostris darwini TaxID=1538125 RepID=A0AAV4UUQ9_9ARAC|nr:hypothetical protein CDAR_2991 [Caerostris darwini]